MDLNPSSWCNSILESLKLHLPSFDFDSSSENEEDVTFDRQADLSLELREHILEDSRTSLTEEAELEPGACENNSKKLQGAKLNVETHVDNTNQHKHFPGLSFAKLDQVDLDKVLQNLKEDGRCVRQCVPAEPPKICADYDTEKSHSNIMDRLAAFCMSQSAGAAYEPVHARLTENKVWNKSPDRMGAKSPLSQRGRRSVHIDLLCPELAIKPPACSEISSESNAVAKHNPRQETPSAKKPASTEQPGPRTAQRAVTCKSMLKVTEMNGNGNEFANKHTDPPESLQGNEEAESQHEFCPVQSAKREQTTNREAEQQSDQQREKVQQKLKRKQHREIQKELEKRRPTKSVCGNQAAVEKTSVLYNGEASHLQPIPALPADIESKACVLRVRDFEAQGLLGCIVSRLDDAQSVEPSCCFHTVPHSSDMFSSFVRDMWAVPDPSRLVLSRQKCEAEVQQVVILTLCGKDMTQGLSLLHRALTGGSEGDAGFELLTLKWLPALTRVQAQELSPYEVGEPHWRGSLDSLMSYPVLACALRGVDALASLQQLLPLDYPGDLSVLMSPTPEVALRQASVLFVKQR